MENAIRIDILGPGSGAMNGCCLRWCQVAGLGCSSGLVPGVARVQHTRVGSQRGRCCSHGTWPGPAPGGKWPRVTPVRDCGGSGLLFFREVCAEGPDVAGRAISGGGCGVACEVWWELRGGLGLVLLYRAWGGGGRGSAALARRSGASHPTSRGLPGRARPAIPRPAAAAGAGLPIALPQGRQGDL